MKENEAFCAQNPNSPKCGGTAEAPPQTGPSDEQVQENEAFCAANPESPKCGGTAEAPPPATDKICAANPKYPGCDALAQPDLGRPEEDGQIGSICEQNPLLPQCQASQETAQPDVPGGRPDDTETEEAAERPGRDEEDGFGGPALPPPLALEEGEAPLPPRTGDLPGSGPPIESPTAPPSIAGGEESCPEGQIYDASTEACVCAAELTLLIDGACIPITEVTSEQWIEECQGTAPAPDLCDGAVALTCEQIEAGTHPAFSGAPEDYAFCREDEPAPEEPVIAEQECAEGQVVWGDQCVWPGSCPEGEVAHLDWSLDPPQDVCLESCPDGMVSREGGCIGVSYCVQQGGVADEGQCVLECPSGKIEEAGACVVAETCPEGTEMQGGSCQPIACQIGEVPVEGVCRPFAEVGYEEFIEACAANFSESLIVTGNPSLGSDYSGSSPERRCQILVDNMCSRAESGAATSLDLSGAPVCEDREPTCDAGEYLASDGSCTASCGEGEYVLDNQCTSACQPPYATIGNECRMGCPVGYDLVQGEQNQCVAPCPAGETRLEDGTCGNPCPEGQLAEYGVGAASGQCREPCPEGQSLYQGQCREQCPDYNGPHTPVNGVCVPEYRVPYEEAVQGCQDGDVNFASAGGASDRASCEATIAESCQAENYVGEREKLYCYEQAGPAPNGGPCPEGSVAYSGACISACPPGTAESGGQCEPVDEPPIADEPPDEDESPVAEGPPEEGALPGEEEPPVAEAPPDDGEPVAGEEQEVAEGDCPEGQLAVDGACRPLTEVGYDEAIESCLEGGSPGWPAMDEDSCAALVAEVCSDIGTGSPSGLPGSPSDYPFCAGPPGDGEEPPIAGEPPIEEEPPVAEAPSEEDEPPYLGFPPIVIIPPGPPDAGEPPEATRPPRRPPVAGPPAGTARPPWPPFLGQPPAAGPPPQASLPPLPRPAPPRPGAEPPVEAAALTDTAGQEAPPTARAEPLAVVIANAVYQSADVPGRPDALANAVEVVRFLKQDVGLAPERIVPLANGQLADFEALFGTREAADGGLQLTLAAAGSSELIIYFAGHGIAVDSGRDAVLLPADADPDQAEQTGYRLSTLYANLAAIGVERLRLFIDASFADALDAQPALEVGPPGSVVAYPIIGPLGTLTPTEWVVVTAGTGTEPTYEDPGAPRSAFTDALIAGLSGEADGDGDGAVTAGELAAFIRARVGSVVKEATGGSQTPALFGSQGEVLSPVGIAKTD